MTCGPTAPRARDGLMYKCIIRPLFFRTDPEWAHHEVVRMVRLFICHPPLSWVMRWWLNRGNSPLASVQMGLHFPNPVGLPAGFDKGGELADGARNLGFAFVEVGTVTPKPQPGNPKPRLFRLPKDEAIINRMGFNSEGAERVARRLARRRANRIPLGASLGKNTSTPQAQALDDYLVALRALSPLVDFLVVNVSCPNVANLCELQREDTLGPLISGIVSEQARLGRKLPLLLKLGPHQSEAALRATVRLALEHGADGFVACNTSPRREGLVSDAALVESIGTGGLSGLPLREEALRTVRILRDEAGPGVPIIGVGGIFTGADALAMLQAGASLVQILTGFIYEGPLAARRINRYLRRHVNDIPVW